MSTQSLSPEALAAIDAEAARGAAAHIASTEGQFVQIPPENVIRCYFDFTPWRHSSAAGLAWRVYLAGFRAELRAELRRLFPGVES